MASYFAYPLNKRLNGLEDLLLLGKRHLEIDLRELGLPVGAEIFVAETADNLKIFFVAAHHQELLEDLRRLRQRVEGSGLHAARHKVIARAFRRGARHEWRFDFEESAFIERLAHGKGDLRAQNDIALHARTSQIDVAVFEARLFGDIDFVFHGERRRARFVEDPDLRDSDFHFARGEIRDLRYRRRA